MEGTIKQGDKVIICGLDEVDCPAIVTRVQNNGIVSGYLVQYQDVQGTIVEGFFDRDHVRLHEYGENSIFTEAFKQLSKRKKQ